MNACTRFLQHRLFPLVQVFAITTVVFLPLSAHAWGEPHLAITKAATEVLPDWQKELLGPEMEMLAGKYCLIPDEVYTDKENARYAAMPETRPGEVYLLNLHLPDASQAVNLDALRYFMGRAVAALKAGQTTDAAKYLGTICHQLEDYGSPSHTVPGDNMFTLLTQFLPPPDDMKGLPMHGPIENGTLDVKIPGYKPQLLGLSVEEASWRLLHRIHEGILNARQTTLPILQALYAKDPETVKTWQMKAAVVDAQVTADALYTVLCLAQERGEPAELTALRDVDIAGFFPIEAVNLYYPQSQFAGSPNWGCARSGFLMEKGTRPVPLKLAAPAATRDNAPAETRELTRGISVVMGKTLTFPLPKNVYGRFTVLAGLHPELGARGRVEFTVLGDGKPLGSVTVNGTDPAQLMTCDLTGISSLQLLAKGRGLDPKANYAIWGEPRVGKR
ncbi:NPCBM/NEW2 domain-containing protein [Verrucomicrobium spinosum]|uniref:NPCBM/NEW2 domain-containing protein n=1 Tax=Verrucomicrobium spinosum TaxID=2736 RepID=UPI00017462B1|nr:NPCBM/NEW2 domain-containing protein [Verrucomicrobium spinosum]